LSARSAPIKSILLNQRLIAGIGNIYADESLFRAGIHPSCEARLVAPHAKTLLAAARQVLKNAIRAKGTTLRDYRSSDNTEGSYQNRLHVYGREGIDCVRCKTTIKKIILGGRGTHFCPRCQPHSRSIV
jgi:formamidopyrimidine-DNA glycosylase